MAQHYPGNTQSVSAWCGKCQAHTQHRVDGHVVSRVCIPCQESGGSISAKPAPKQTDFSVTTFLDWETGRARA